MGKIAKVKINIDALKEAQENMKSGSDGLFVGQSELKPNLYIRLMPSQPNISSLGFFEEDGFWIKGKRYVSPETFGKPCPISEEVEEALASGDPVLQALLNHKDFKRKKQVSFPICILNAKNEKTYQFDGVRDNMVKILQTGPQLGSAIIKLLVNAPGCEPEELLEQEGYIIQCTKTGEKIDTEYSAQVIVRKFNVPDELYDYDKIPDILELCRKKLKSDDYLRGVVRNYLYGEPMPVEESNNDIGSAPDAIQRESVKAEPKGGQTKPRRSLMEDLMGS